MFASLRVVRSWRFPATATAVLAAALVAGLMLGTGVVRAVATGGSGTYTVGTAFNVAPGGTVNIPVSRGAFTMGTDAVGNARFPEVCYSVSGSGVGTYTGSLTMNANPRSLSISTSPSATAGQTFTVVFSLPCSTVAGVPDTGTINGGASATVTVTYGTTAGPSVTNISPQSGPVGQSVTITGTNFTPGTTAQFVGVTTVAAAFTYSSPTTGFVTVPAGVTVGNTYDIILNNGSGTSAATAADRFTVTASGTAPVITLVNPSSGVAGNTVTIYGSGFTGTSCPSGVTFGFVAVISCAVGVGGTTITAVVPSGTGTVHVHVFNGIATSTETNNDLFTYTGSAISVTNASNNSGPTTGGTVLQLTGVNLNQVVSVTIDGVPCAINSQVTSTLTCVTGPHVTAGTYPIVVNGSVTAFYFTYGAGGTVVITAISPTSGPTAGGTLITLSGTNVAAVYSVMIDGVPCTGVVPATYTVTCTTGAHAIAGTYTVYVNGAATGVTFTYGTTGIPVITSVSPASGAPGTSVVITGYNFTGTLSVRFGGVAGVFTINSDTQITVTVPTGIPAGTMDIVVTNLSGSSANTTADNFTNSTPTTTTVTYSLYSTWTLVAWAGASGTDVTTALSGSSTNAQLNNILSRVTAVILWDAPNQRYKLWFPADIPGSRDFTTFTHGLIYWVAITSGGSVSWTVIATAN